MDQVEPITEQEDHPKASRRSWLIYAFLCSFAFAAEFVFLVQITEVVGPVCIFYNTSGGIIIGFVYYFYIGVVGPCFRGKKMKDQNFILDGQIKWRNVVGMVAYCLLLIACEVFVYLTLFFSKRAKINPGIITTIWSVDPLFMAFSDKVFFKQKMEYYHYVGMMAIIVCSVILSMSDYVYSEEVVDLSL